MNKPKAQGTKAETRIVTIHQSYGIMARRLPEGGQNDLGDVEIYPSTGPSPIVGEVKDKERLNLHDALDAAVRKSGTHRTVLFWTKRSMANPTTGIRRSVTQRLVAIPESLWLELIGGRDEERL